MQPIVFDQFDKLYQDEVTGVLSCWTPEMQAEIAAHCHGWRPEAFDFSVYLRRSAKRFYLAYRLLTEQGVAEMCDVGGFWGAFPAVLVKLGFRVTMTETLKYYSAAFQELFARIEKAGVQVVDYDPFEPGAAAPSQFPAVAVMAVLEHYPHSLQPFMTNMLSMLSPGGFVYIEVPNIAYWPNRLALLRGRSPLSPLRDIYASRVPFIGHHHEFTRGELLDLGRLAGLELVCETNYNYSVQSGSWRSWLARPLSAVAFRCIPGSRECLAALFRRSAA
jgi:2-polyprenyl-3-methyl-5-hydroxy-6-metoxy-1,4-benzoquinol methylase